MESILEKECSTDKPKPVYLWQSRVLSTKSTLFHAYEKYLVPLAAKDAAFVIPNPYFFMIYYIVISTKWYILERAVKGHHHKSPR